MQISEVFNDCVQSLYYNCGHLVTTFRGELLRERAALYAEAVMAAGGPLDSCVGFIDGTKIRITRPGGPPVLQQAVYNGRRSSKVQGLDP